MHIHTFTLSNTHMHILAHSPTQLPLLSHESLDDEESVDVKKDQEGLGVVGTGSFEQIYRSSSTIPL